MTYSPSSDIGSNPSTYFSSPSTVSSVTTTPDPTSSNTSKPNLINNPSQKNLSQCKSFFVEALVNTAVYIIDAMWPFSSSESASIDIKSLPLKTFIQETLRRSRTSYSTLQLTLYYLVLIKPHVYDHRDKTKSSDSKTIVDRRINPLNCGRRTFLAALMLASKYSQDRNYSVAAWSKISGLSTSELRINETSFLDTVKWNLFVPYDVYERWGQLLFECACDPVNPSAPNESSHFKSHEEKRRVWINRFTSVNTSITNCTWIKHHRSVAASVPSSSDSISPDLSACPGKTHNNGGHPSPHANSLIAYSPVSLRSKSNSRVYKSVSNSWSSKQKLGARSSGIIPQTLPKGGFARFAQKLSVKVIMSADNGSTEVIVNDNYLGNI